MSTTLQKTIPSYAYTQYADDDDIQGFFAAFNTLAQQYVNTFNALNLPVYTGDLIVGALLDWVALGLYGLARPLLPYGVGKNLGPYNTSAFNSLYFNESKLLGPTTYYATTDDIFKRILTWHLYKGDGKVFNIRWLKRRIMRFLLGVNGTSPDIGNTYQVSVTFGPSGQVNIRIINALRVVAGGAIYNAFAFNTQAFDGLQTTVEQFIPFAAAPTFQAAVQAGVLELPFQFTWIVVFDNIGPTPEQTGLLNNSGFLQLTASLGYPASPSGLAAGQVWSDSAFVGIVAGITPNPAAAPVFFGSITAAGLLLLGGGNLPLTDPHVLNQVWNNGGFGCVSLG